MADTTVTLDLAPPEAAPAATPRPGAAPVAVRAEGQDLLSGDSATGGLRLEPGGCAVLALAPDAPITLLED